MGSLVHNLPNGLHLAHDLHFHQQEWNTMVYYHQLVSRYMCGKRHHYIGRETYKAYWHLAHLLFRIHLGQIGTIRIFV